MLTTNRRNFAKHDFRLTLYTVSWNMNVYSRMRITFMPDRKNKVRIGIPDQKYLKSGIIHNWAKGGHIVGFPPKWRPTRGHHSLRPAKIKTVWPQIVEIVQNLTHKCRKSIQNDIWLNEYTVSRKMNFYPRMRVILMPDRKNTVRIGFAKAVAIFFLQNGGPLGGATLGARQNRNSMLLGTCVPIFALLEEVEPKIPKVPDYMPCIF